MSNYDRERFEMDAVQRDLSIGLNMRVAGWTLLLFDFIPLMFVWVGFRSGSLFWTYWTVIEGTLGIVLVMLGDRFRSRAGTHISRLGPTEVEGGSKAA